MNVHTPTFMRAPGEASGVFALESAMDELAVALGIDPVELRLRNEPDSTSSRSCRCPAARPGNATGSPPAFRLEPAQPEPRSMRDGRWLIGWGMATATYP